MSEVKKSRKRARPCPRLDDDDVKEEMRQLYQVLLWKPDEIAAEINRNHNLTVTPNQVRDKLNKWGYKKRFCPGQSEAIYRHIAERSKLGKQSEVVIDGVIMLYGKKLQRAMTRNVKATVQHHISKGIINAPVTSELPENIQICTPKPISNLELFLPRVPVARHIPISIQYNLPIWQFSRSLENINLRYPSPGLYNSENLKITAHHSIPHSPLLRLIIYKISNNLDSSWDSNFGHEMLILERVNQFRLREPLKRLLSNDSLTIRAVCENILPWLYMRQDHELVQFICETHGIKLNRYEALRKFRSDFLKWGASSLVGHELSPAWIKMAFEEIESAKSLPRSLLDLETLLEVCRDFPGSMMVFQRIWDQKPFPDIDILTQIEEKYNWVGSTPLAMQDLDQLRVALGLGFTRFQSGLTIRAILNDNYDVVRAFLEHFDLIEDRNNNLSSTILKTGDRTNQKRTWEKIEIPLFHQIITKALAVETLPQHRRECRMYKGEHAWKHRLSELRTTTGPPAIHEIEHEDVEYEVEYEDIEYDVEYEDLEYEVKYEDFEYGGWSSVINRALVLVAYLNPEMVDYIIKVLSWANPSLTQSEVTQRAPNSGKRLFGNFYHDEQYFLKFEYEDILRQFRILLNWPNAKMIDSYIQLPTERLQLEYSRVFGSSSAVCPPVKPICAALLLRRPEAFLLFFESSTAELRHLLSPGGNHRTDFTFDGKFIQACHSRDVRRIQDLWDYRIKAVPCPNINLFQDPEIEIFLRKKDFNTASSLSLQSESHFIRIKTFLAIAEAWATDTLVPRPGTSCKVTDKNTPSNLLQTILDAGILLPPQGTESGSSEFQVYNKKYGIILRDAISSKRVELVDFLLRFEKQVNLRSSWAPRDLPASEPTSQGRLEDLRLEREGCSLRKLGFIPSSRCAYFAAQSSLEILKLLIEHGFNINEDACGCPILTGRYNPWCFGGMTALHGAIKSGNMETIVFVLQKGPDIYARCGNFPSSIEFAIYRGRLDAIALILSIDPNCYNIALQAAETTEYAYIAEYVRNWTPENASSNILSDQNTSQSNISEYLPVAFSAGSP
ncbi:hypothetical protein TWF481_006295 [Arthrobotrys musiformis]|uniref:Clr5 domain-containing protein n=1 Tax=Arthrobotrys musiformis TaxID=47236 RepID=A0AAV9WG92_9PEZI